MEPSVRSTAAQYFGDLVASYDSLIARTVPRYAEMTARLLEYLPRSPANILELGCGTGNLSLALAARHPQASITLVDASPEMIDVARTRLESAHPKVARRAHFVTARFEDLDLPARSFDVATSCISLHHVRDKAAVYRALHAVLAPSGTLRFADQLRAATDFDHATNWEHWLAFSREPEHCTADELQGLLDHAAAHDHYTSLVDHVRLLEAAGFRDIDCVWRNWMWGIVTAEK